MFSGSGLANAARVRSAPSVGGIHTLCQWQSRVACPEFFTKSKFRLTAPL
jgi:hypothetical protein